MEPTTLHTAAQPRRPTVQYCMYGCTVVYMDMYTLLVTVCTSLLFHGPQRNHLCPTPKASIQ
jgi:hypothetical protein